MVISLYDEYEYLFCYNYPHYPLYKDFGLEKYREIISNADDRINNQLRVTKTGLVYLSYKDIGCQNILGLKFRSETYRARNVYVGPKAASNYEYIKNKYEQLINVLEM